jgi:putative membrane protein
MLRFVITGVIFLAFEYFYFTKWQEQKGMEWAPYIAAIVFVSPLLRLLRRQFITTTITGDRLRYETGAFSKSTRTIQLSKLQDVRVDQKPLQRMFGVGNISIETAGEASRLTIEDVDSPQAIADDILNRAQKGGASV